MKIVQPKRYLSDLIYGVFVKGKRLPIATFETEDEAETFTRHYVDREPHEFEIVPLAEVSLFTEEAMKYLECTH